MKMMQGECFLASLKSARTRLAPTPTNISSKSDPEQNIKLHPASPAMALAKSVFPVPGSPNSMTPLNKFEPLSLYLSGFLMILIMFSTSSLISSIPLTSSRRYSISVAVLISNLAFPPNWSVFPISFIMYCHPNSKRPTTTNCLRNFHHFDHSN